MKKYGFLALLTAAIASTGCNNQSGSSAPGTSTSGSSGAPNSASVIAVKANAQVGGGSITNVSGTYTGCRTTDLMWSVDFVNGVLSKSNISVYPGENTCVLAATSVTYADNSKFESAVGLPLGAHFLDTAVSFTNTATRGIPANILMNGEISDPTFSGNAVNISFLSSGLVTNNYGVAPTRSSLVVSPAEGINNADNTIIPSPFGTFAFYSPSYLPVAPSVFSLVTDPSGQVTGTTNEVYLRLTAAGHPGETYIVVKGSLADYTPQTLFTSYNNAIAAGGTVYTIGGDLSQVNVTADQLALVGDTVVNNTPLYRTVIIKHVATSADGTISVSAFEAILMSFL